MPIIFAETRKLAQQWTYRFLVACREDASAESLVEARLEDLVSAGPLDPGPALRARVARAVRDASIGPDTAAVRAWAREQGLPVADRGRLRPEVIAAYLARTE